MPSTVLASPPTAALRRLVARALKQEWSVREAVAALRAEDPHLRGSDMARWLGVSRERVRRMLAALDLPTTVPGENRGGQRPRPKRRKRGK